MSPKERRKRLLEYLEIIDKWITTKELANNLGVSERTIHSDIKGLNENFKETEIAIVRKRGVGVKLINNLEVTVESHQHSIPKITDRKVLILAKLLIHSEIVTYKELAEEYFVSISSIKNDLDDIKKHLVEYTNVQCISDISGTKIIGSELEKREAMIWFNQDILNSASTRQKNKEEEVKGILQQFYGRNLVYVAYDILLNFVIKNNSLLSDYYFFNTLSVYIIQLSRLVNGRKISKNIEKFKIDEFKDIEEFTMGASQLLSRASSRLSFEYNECEIEYLSKYLIVNRFEQLPDEASNIQFINELIVHLSEALNVNFRKDKHLLQELKQHVPPMIFRLKLGIKVDNPFLIQIKNEYPQTFYTIMLAISKFESDYQLEFNEDEVALLTIYFQSAIEKQRLNRKILVICQYGIATSELLVNRLKNELGATDMIESASVGELNYFNLDNYDLIISSTDVVSGGKVINVSPFLNHREIIDIKNRLNITDKTKSEPEQKLKHINSFIDIDYIFEDAQFDNQSSLLNKIGDKLVKDNYVEPNYIASVIHRETLGNTDLPEGIATPHGDPSMVNKSVIVMIQNSKKIRWSKYLVDKIFILIISEKDVMQTKDIIKELYKLINNDNIMNNFKKYLIEMKEELSGDL